MKSKLQNTKSRSGLRVQSSNHQEQPEKTPLPQISFERRRANRQLATDTLIELLRNEAPRLFELAEVVGKWVWVQFTDKQPREVTAALAELGFHWNNKRQVWQHPCGALTAGTKNDPREKYPTYFPADTRAA